METLRTPDPPEIKMHHVPPRVQTPPTTPSTQSQYPSIASHSSPLHRHPWQSVQTAPQPPGNDHIHPLGYGHSFSYTRSQSTDISSHPSSASGRPVGPSATGSRSRSDRDRSTSRQPRPLSRRVLSEGAFTVEEIAGSEKSFSSDLEVLRPDSYEDATSNAEESRRSDSESRQGSVSGLAQGIAGFGFGCLNEEQRKKKEKRRSLGILKRPLGESLGSDTDMEDVSGLNARQMAKTGRRQRLRIDGVEDDDSLTPEGHISDAWLDAENSVEGDSTRPTTSGSDTNVRAAQTLPFFPMEDIMQIDRESSRDTTPH
ncbi:MAG: hypothetical protein M1821_002236 [Bathelium mastoideum]|nr:MAG: hypothetical protein M1821_002236 [Bathelium mastoideum]KAI9676706.1 MAG: hypothetical protein M1822_008269 [Bathelium mastoideum]